MKKTIFICAALISLPACSLANDYDECMVWTDAVLAYQAATPAQRGEVVNSLDGRGEKAAYVYRIHNYVRKFEIAGKRLSHSAILHQCLKDEGVTKL